MNDICDEQEQLINHSTRIEENGITEKNKKYCSFIEKLVYVMIFHLNTIRFNSCSVGA
jgi:hypothetical protein